MVPTDFSPVCRYALAHASCLAQTDGHAPLRLLHVTGQMPGDHVPAGSVTVKKIMGDLQLFSTGFEPATGPSIEKVIRHGNLFRAVNQFIAETRPGLVVIGTHGKQGLQYIYGSHALRMVIDSGCPVMVVQEPPPANGYRQMVVPLTSETDPGQMALWIRFLSRAGGPPVRFLRPTLEDPAQEKLIADISTLITYLLEEHGIPCRTETAGPGSDFAENTVRKAEAIQAGLILAMKIPSAGATGYDFARWNEQLMFNTGKIPVLFIDRAPDEPNA